MITHETRRESYELICKDLPKRKKKIIQILRFHRFMTASDIAGQLYIENLIPYPARNFVQPRLTELCNDGIVEVFYKKRDFFTGRTVAVYRIKEEIK